MFNQEFYSNIDFNKLIATEDIFQEDIKQTYPVCYLINLYLNNSFKQHKTYSSTNVSLDFVSIKRDTLRNILGRRILERLKKKHLFYKVFEVDNNYKFNKSNVSEIDKEDSFTKAYKLKNSFILKLLINKLSLDSNVLYSYTKFKKQKHYLINGKSFSNRSEVLKNKIITRKEFDMNKHKYLEYYNSLIYKKPKEITFSDIETEEVKVDYYTNLTIDTKKVLKKVEDLDIDFINTLTEHQALEYFKMAMLLKQNESSEKKMYYKRHESGRLVGVKIPNISVNFQTLPKWQREIIFEGKYEYDLSNAVITLFMNLYKQLNGDKKLINILKYMNNKDLYRNILINLGFSEKLAKQYFITILYGKDLSNNIEESYKHTDWMQEINQELFFKALEDERIEKLLQELDYLKEYLVNYYKSNASISKGRYTIRNANNRYKTFTKFEIEKNKGKVLAHLFFGLESLIMDYIKEYFNINLLIYDGFITDEDIDLEFLNLLIEQELGYKVKFSKRLIKG